MKLVEALARFLAIQAWSHLPLAKDGKPYGPGFFAKRDWASLLVNKNRKVSMRLMAYGRCIACGIPLPAGSTGDHLVPLAKGGPDDASNYIPLCRSCNASKGKRDFMEWWVSKGYNFSSMPKDTLADILCAYARLTYEASSEEALQSEAPEYVQAAMESVYSLIPVSHRPSLLQATASHEETRREGRIR